VLLYLKDSNPNCNGNDCLASTVSLRKCEVIRKLGTNRTKYLNIGKLLISTGVTKDWAREEKLSWRGHCEHSGHRPIFPLCTPVVRSSAEIYFLTMSRWLASQRWRCGKEGMPGRCQEKIFLFSFYCFSLVTFGCNIKSRQRSFTGQP